MKKLFLILNLLCFNTYGFSQTHELEYKSRIDFDFTIYALEFNYERNISNKLSIGFGLLGGLTDNLYITYVDDFECTNPPNYICYNKGKTWKKTHFSYHYSLKAFINIRPSNNFQFHFGPKVHPILHDLSEVSWFKGFELGVFVGNDKFKLGLKPEVGFAKNNSLVLGVPFTILVFRVLIKKTH